MCDELFELRCFRDQPIEDLAVAGDAFAQLLDLTLGCENAARFRLAAAGHEVRATQDVSVQGRDGQCRSQREVARRVERVDDERVSDHPANCDLVLGSDANDAR
jgi:hypothetical protein